MPERSLLLSFGSMGVGKTRITHAFKASVENKKNEVIIFNRDNAAEGFGEEFDVKLSKEEVDDIYLRHLKYAYAALTHETLKHKNVYVFIEGNWGDRNRLRFLADRLERFINFNVQVLFFSSRDVMTQVANVVARNNPKDHKLIEKNKLFKHIMERRNIDEQAIKDYGNVLSINRIDATSLDPLSLLQISMQIIKISQKPVISQADVMRAKELRPTTVLIAYPLRREPSRWDVLSLAPLGHSPNWSMFEAQIYVNQEEQSRNHDQKREEQRRSYDLAFAARQRHRTASPRCDLEEDCKRSRASDTPTIRAFT